MLTNQYPQELSLFIVTQGLLGGFNHSNVSAFPCETPTIPGSTGYSQLLHNAISIL